MTMSADENYTVALTTAIDNLADIARTGGDDPDKNAQVRLAACEALVSICNGMRNHDRLNAIIADPETFKAYLASGREARL